MDLPPAVHAKVLCGTGFSWQIDWDTDTAVPYLAAMTLRADGLDCRPVVT